MAQSDSQAANCYEESVSFVKVTTSSPHALPTSTRDPHTLSLLVALLVTRTRSLDLSPTDILDLTFVIE